MDPTVLIVLISLMFIMALLLIGTIHSRLHWLTKSFFILFSLAVVAMDYKVLTDSLGWPVKDELPDDLQVLGVEIREPSNSASKDGAIYVWYRTYDQGTKPRSVQIEYTENMHRTMSKAQAMLAQGEQVHMSRYKQGKGNQGNRTDGEGTDIGEQRRGQSNFQSPGPLDFVPPPDALPLKD